MAELRDQTQDVLVERPVTIQQFSRQIAFNAIPHIDSFLTDGYTKEERKMLDESRKILHEPDLAVSATCVRIPTMISHAMAVHVDFDEPISVTDARACWETQPGLELFDDPLNEIYPTPLECTDQDATFVGRVRQDVSSQNGLAFWCVTDNLRKGAALNILQMVEWMQERDCL
jgi:aspartate-semialdehyde dehydrogenase